MVNYDYIDDSRIMVNTSKIGLATDCPGFEKEFWDEYVRKAKKKIDAVFSEPQEIVAAKAEETRDKIEGFHGKEQVLDRFQNESIRKRINELEPEVMNTKVYNILDTEKYKDEIKKNENSIRKQINCRITKRNIFLISFTVLLIYAGGFIPYLINARKIDMEVFMYSLSLVIGAIVLLCLCGFIVLRFLRRRLVKILEGYNKNIRNMLDTINKGAQVFSDYFSSVCTYMYAHSLLSGVTIKKDKDFSVGKLQKAHLKTIENEIIVKELLCSLYKIDLKIPSISPIYIDYNAINKLPMKVITMSLCQMMKIKP